MCEQLFIKPCSAVFVILFLLPLGCGDLDSDVCHCCTSFPTQPHPHSPHSSNTNLQSWAIIATAVGGGIVALILLLLADLFFYGGLMWKSRVQRGMPCSDIGKLVFFDGCSYSFKVDDIWNAVGVDLETGTIGTGYRMQLGSTTVFLKSLKGGVVEKEVFERKMDRIGRVGQHPNVVPVRAYYYSQDEKFLVYDYYRPWGSLMHRLHGEVGTRDGQITLDWETKLKIALGAARGIAHLHSMGFTHGNIKPSNVLINEEKDGCISDYGLLPLMKVPPHHAGGYQAPEVVRTRKHSQESDVYSFGVILLEMLTEKPQNQSPGRENMMDLPTWVRSSFVVFVPKTRDPDIEEEMVRALGIGKSCVELVPRDRPTIHEVVQRLQEIR